MLKPINPLGFANVLSSNLTARPWEYHFPRRAFMLWQFFPNAGFFTRVSTTHKAQDLLRLPGWSTTAARKLHHSKEVLQTCCNGHIEPISLSNCTVWQWNFEHICTTNLVLNKPLSVGCINQTHSAKHLRVTPRIYRFPVWEGGLLAQKSIKETTDCYKNMV